MAADLELTPKTKRAAGERCCESVVHPDVERAEAVEMATLSHHLEKLRDAGIVDSERRGLWADYYVRPEALAPLAAWLHA